MDSRSGHGNRSLLPRDLLSASARLLAEPGPDRGSLASFGDASDPGFGSASPISQLQQFRVDLKLESADSPVHWLNDLESPDDPRYAQWNPSIRQGLLQPSYPGQLKYIRRNIFK